MSEIKSHGSAGQESGGSSDQFYILRITNQKKQVGYVAKVDEKLVIALKLIPEIVRFPKYNIAKELGKQFRNSKIEILDKSQVEKLLLTEAAEITVPLNDMDVDVFHIIVKDKATSELWGYLTYNQGTDEYSIVKTTEGAAFWPDVIKAGAFISAAEKVIQANYPNLTLEIKKFNKHTQNKILTP